MSELPLNPHSRRRRRWIVLAFVGVVGLAGWWWVAPILEAVDWFLVADLRTKDSISSVAAMVIGAASLLLSICFGLPQSILARGSGAEAESLPPQVARERDAADRLRAYLGRQDNLRRMADPATQALALRVHPAVSLSQPASAASAAPSAMRMRSHSRWRGPTFQYPRVHSREMYVLDRDLPAFVERDVGPELRAWMGEARATGGFLLLIGDSCVGKTRLLYEAAREALPDFAVLAPDLGDSDLVNKISETNFPLPKVIVWLDELQRFLDGPYLTPGSTPITAAAVRRLLDAPTPAVIVGTLWPQYANQLRASRPDPATGRQRSRFPNAVDVLDCRRLHEMSLQTFSRQEREAAARLASYDPRLGQALADQDYNVTEALAGAREMVNRYERATQEQKAVLHAAIDARRVGIHAPLTEPLLRTASRGYLTTVQPDDAWFSAALAELTSRERPQDRAAAPLIVVASADHGRVLGYSPAEYLLQRLSRQRRSVRMSSATWQAFACHTHNLGDLARLADNAHRRLLYQEAEPLFRRLADTGNGFAAARLADLLSGQGRTDEAIEALRPHVAGNGLDAWLLAVLLNGQGKVGEAIETLRPHAVAGDRVGAVVAMLLADLLAWHGFANQAIEVLRPHVNPAARPAAWLLADLLVMHARTHDALEVLAIHAAEGDTAWRHAALMAGRGRADGAIEILQTRPPDDAHATWLLAQLLVDQGRIDEAIDALRTHADAGDRDTAWRLAALLTVQVRIDDAIDVLRALADEDAAPEADYASRRTYLREQGDIGGVIEALRMLVDSGDGYAGRRLAALLADRSIEELQAEVDAGTPGAAEYLIKMLTEQDRTSADRLRKFGFNPDGKVGDHNRQIRSQ